MMVKLLAPHVFNDRLYLRDTVLNVTIVTPLMEPLDEAARAAIAAEKNRVYGRYIHPGVLLDDPPIERPLTDPQPVPAVGGGGPGR
jgi:hypothetical protein